MIKFRKVAIHINSCNTHTRAKLYQFVMHNDDIYPRTNTSCIPTGYTKNADNSSQPWLRNIVMAIKIDSNIHRFFNDEPTG